MPISLSGPIPAKLPIIVQPPPPAPPLPVDDINGNGNDNGDGDTSSSSGGSGNGGGSNGAGGGSGIGVGGGIGGSSAWPSLGPVLPQAVQTNQVAFSHSGRELLVTTGAGTVRILSYPDLQMLHTLNAHTSACLSLELSPRGDSLAVGGSDALLSVWDTLDWVPRYTLSDMAGPVRSVSFSFDGSYVCGGSDEGTGIDIVCGLPFFFLFC